MAIAFETGLLTLRILSFHSDAIVRESHPLTLSETLSFSKVNVIVRSTAYEVNYGNASTASAHQNLRMKPYTFGKLQTIRFGY